MRRKSEAQAKHSSAYKTRKSKREIRKERQCKLNPKDFPKEVLANQSLTKNEKTMLRAKRERITKKRAIDMIKNGKKVIL